MWRSLLALCSIAVAAQDLRIDSLRRSLVGMRTATSADFELRGASPVLTEVKHYLRDWVESRMKEFKQDGEVADLTRALNADLRAADLLCSWDRSEKRCPGNWQGGYLLPLEFRREKDFLVLITHVGILCGFDDSAYLYRWSEQSWHRTWQTEQNNYGLGHYKPESIHSVQVSPSNQLNDYLVLTLGTQSWCSSAWHPVYYRVFRPGPDVNAKPLLDGEDWAFISSDIQGSITADDALVEFSVRSIDGAIHNRKAIRHFKIDHATVTRVDPLALGPRDFVEEWLTHAWPKDALHWSEEANRRSMIEWHLRLHKDSTFAANVSTLHCASAPDLWQVAFDFSDPPTPFDKPPVGTYFLVRWRPPYRFSMVRVSDRPDPGCTEEDRQADEKPRTLFPGR